MLTCLSHEERRKKKQQTQNTMVEGEGRLSSSVYMVYVYKHSS